MIHLFIRSFTIVLLAAGLSVSVASPVGSMVDLLCTFPSSQSDGVRCRPQGNTSTCCRCCWTGKHRWRPLIGSAMSYIPIPCHAMGMRKYESIQISLAQLLQLLLVCMYVLLTLLYAALRMEMLRYIGLRLMGSSKWWSVYSIKARP